MPIPLAGTRTRLLSVKSFFLLLLVAALWLAGVHLPGPPVTGLESWHAILVDAHLQKRHFGSEIAFTYGPWGFLSLSGYQLEALGIKFRWEIVGKLLLAITLVAATAHFTGARRWTFLGLLIVGVPFFDNTASLAVALLSLVWLLPADVPWWKRLIALFWLGLFSHFKFVFCLQAVCGVAIACAVHAWEKRGRLALSLLAGYAAIYLLSWLAAGQRLTDLPEYVRQSWEISSGYSWAMGVEPSGFTPFIALWVVGHCIALALALWRTDRSRALRTGLIALGATQWFIAWKQGFTRADDHVFGFYFFCLYFGMALSLLLPPRSAPRWHDLSVVACLAGIGLTHSFLATYGPRTAWNRIKRFPYELTHLDGWTARFSGAFASATKAAADPALVQQVGRASIDLFTHEQGILLLNGLNYQPRPISQSYTTYTRTLLEKNAAFYRSPRAPEFVTIRLKAIDRRYPGQEDSLALLEIARRYEMVDNTPEHALLRRKSPAASDRGDPSPAVPANRPLLGATSLAFGQRIPVPAGDGHAVWMEVDLQPTMFGRINTFLYHAYQPQLIATYSDGHEERFRLISTLSSCGYVIRPFIETHRDWIDLIQGHDRGKVTEIRIELESPHDRALWQEPAVRFFSLPDLPLRPTSE